MKEEALISVIESALEDLKAVDLEILNVRDMTSVMDLMVIVTGTSSRHVKSLADNVVVKVAKAGMRPIGVEGDRDSEWVLVDLGDIVVHIMQPQARAFYNLEKLWDSDLQIPEDAAAGDGS